MALTAPGGGGPSPDAGGGNPDLARTPDYEGFCLLQQGFDADHLRKALVARIPHLGRSAQECQNFENPALSPASKLTKAGESWKQLTACSRPSHHVPPPMTAAGKINIAVLWTLQYHERGLYHCLEGRREGLSDAREETVYPFKLSMPRRQWP